MSLKVQPYISDNGFENCTVVSKSTLNYLEIGENSNKFYTIELHEENGKLRIFTDYGRLGVSSKKELRYPSCMSEAEQEVKRIFKSKVAKGYVEIKLAQSNTGSQKAKELIDPTQFKLDDNKVVAKKSSLSPAIQKLVTHFYEEAGNKLNQLVKGNSDSNGASPLGKLSVEQIDKGRQTLQEIADVISNPTKEINNQILTLSNHFYKLIPKSFGRRITQEAMMIRDEARINNEMEILKFYEDSLRIGDVIFDTSNLDKQYTSLNSDIDTLDSNSDKYKSIVHYVNSTESNHHDVHLAVKNIYTVNQKKAPNLTTTVGNVRELFHGSRSANMVGILSSHLKLPSQLKGVHITGAMFGGGLYFADQSTKSSQYSCSRFGGTANRSDIAFMFLVDVALGTIKEEYNAKYYNEAPKGYHSVQGVASNNNGYGRGLLHNEFIVYKEEQHRINYIIEFESKNKR